MMRRNRQERRENRKKAGLAFVGLIIAFCAVMFILKKIDNQPIKPTEAEEETSERIEYKGVTYIPKKNIETYLFMGVDAEGKTKKVEEYGEGSQCDMLFIMVRDLSDGTYRTMPIDRNTMTEVNSLMLDGTYLATTRNQIAYAHSDGDGLEISCENVVEAVSGLLKGQTIDGYAALNMGAIEILNHLVGGVTVTIQEDFSKADPSLKEGEQVTLTDEQAVTYVRGRMSVGDGSNEGRMKRQSTYLEALEPMLTKRCQEDSSFPLEVYDALKEYMVTNISKQKFSKIALLAAKDKSLGEVTIEGTSKIGDMDLIEFEPEEESLMEAILTLFYKEEWNEGERT